MYNIKPSTNSTKRFNPMTKVRVDTSEMMKFIKGKRMQESDLCMFLEDLGVVLDRATWTHFKEVYAKSHETKENGESLDP